MLKGGMGHYASETGFADIALANVVVAVDAGAAELFGVVGVDGGQVFRADGGVELVNHSGDAGGSGQVVAGGEAVLGVQANPQAGAIHRLQQLPQFLEAGADVLPHSGHIFQAEVGAGGAVVQHLVDGADDLVKDGIKTLPFVAAGMENYAIGVEGGGQFHIVGEGMDALLHQVGVGAAEVDEVDGVEKDGAHAGVGAALLKGGDFLIGGHLERPAAGRGAEQLDGFAADFQAAVDGFADAAGGGDMGADLHNFLPFLFRHGYTGLTGFSLAANRGSFLLGKSYPAANKNIRLILYIHVN